MQYDIVAIGEILIDFTPSGHSEQGNPLFERNPGGAPANVLASLANLKRNTAFIGKVGNDSFGQYLGELLQSKGVNTDGLIYSEDEHTTLVFVQLNYHGERSFTFYRKPGADMRLTKEELNHELLKNTGILHFGSVSLTCEPSRSATLEAARYAKEAGALVSFDPNVRLSLWQSEEDALAQVKESLQYADIVKLSYEELEFITGTSDLNAGTKQLYDMYGTKLILVTLGEGGSYYRANAMTGMVPGFPVMAVDTTGAGDAFLSGVLHQLMDSNKRIEDLTAEELKCMIRFGNGLGALVVTKKGAITSMPSYEEIAEFLSERQ